MPDVCQQMDRINHIESDFTALAKEIRDGQKASMELLREIGQQSARIVNIEDGMRAQKKSIDAAFERIRALELTPGKLAVKTLMILSGVGGSIITGVVVYYLTKGH